MAGAVAASAALLHASVVAATPAPVPPVWTPPPPAPTPAPASPAVRYHCDLWSGACVEQSAGHSTMANCQAACVSEAPPRHVVDLDSPPETRWRGAVAKILAKYSWEESFGSSFESHNLTLFRNFDASIFAALARAVDTHYAEHAAEMRGLSRDFADEGYVVTYEYLAAWVWFHELAHSDLGPEARMPRSCTGVVVEDSSGGIWHGRNMDQHPASVRKLTLAIDFVRGNVTVFRGIDWYWFTTGVCTAVRRGVVSVQENWRGQGDVLDHVAMLAAIDAGAMPHVFAFRAALANDSMTTQGAVDFLSSVPMAAPEYIVVGGSKHGEGWVIARTLKGSAGTVQLGDVNPATPASNHDQSDGAYFIVETNYDHWKPDDFLDDRRTVAVQAINKLGQVAAASHAGLESVMSGAPVCNSGTAYTVIMSATTGAIDGIVRDPHSC